MISTASLHERCLTGVDFTDTSLSLEMTGIRVRVRSNKTAILQQLASYFKDVISPSQSDDPELQIIEGDSLQDACSWTEWQREASKTKRKDGYYDLEGGRVLYKWRTGMSYLLTKDHCLAIGPCLANLNQVINFIINYQMTRLQQKGWLICHAAAMSIAGKAIAFAGFSGGGKSTAMLHCMQDQRCTFVSNDRLFLKRDGDRILARGVPKMPRVNPGTMLHDRSLRHQIPEQDIARYESMPTAALWELEEKRDVLITDTYGPGRIGYEAELSSLYILDWSRHSTAATTITAVRLAEHQNLLAALMKDPGPFFHDADYRFHQNGTKLKPERYLAVLETSDIQVASGSVDFTTLKEHCLQTSTQ